MPTTGLKKEINIVEVQVILLSKHPERSRSKIQMLRGKHKMESCGTKRKQGIIKSSGEAVSIEGTTGAEIGGKSGDDNLC